MDEGKPERYSKAIEPELVGDPAEKAILEVKNALRQFDEGIAFVDEAIRTRSFVLRPSLIVKLNRVALQGLSSYAGVYRPDEIEIVGSRHKPISAELVPAELERFCDYVNAEWNRKSALHLAAYALWRINWIHPFVDGNGRTARIVSYVILCVKLGYRIPGSLTIPEQIAENKEPYYKALEDADHYYDNGRIELTKLENLLSGCLANQLLEIHDEAQKRANSAARMPQTHPDLSRRIPTENRWGMVSWVEAHPVITGAIALLLAAVITAFFQV